MDEGDVLIKSLDAALTLNHYFYIGSYFAQYFGLCMINDLEARAAMEIIRRFIAAKIPLVYIFEKITPTLQFVESLEQLEFVVVDKTVYEYKQYFALEYKNKYRIHVRYVEYVTESSASHLVDCYSDIPLVTFDYNFSNKEFLEGDNYTKEPNIIYDIIITKIDYYTYRKLYNHRVRITISKGEYRGSHFKSSLIRSKPLPLFSLGAYEDECFDNACFKCCIRLRASRCKCKNITTVGDIIHKFKKWETMLYKANGKILKLSDFRTRPLSFIDLCNLNDFINTISKIK